MCGIAGTFGGGAKEARGMLKRIEHRGPDGMGLHQADRAIHGHVRLALVDLSDASSQPFIGRSSCLSFNGEIWNFKELRQELQDEGFAFKTSGDTEVLCALLERHGILCALKKLDGMFAFAWTDKDGQTWLARDSFGKVPLYVAKIGSAFYWASERKAFPKGMNPVSVPAGHAFNFQSCKWHKWYTLPDSKSISSFEVLSKLKAGVAKRMTADAPVCCLISGGLDSSLILSLAREHHSDLTAFTAVFDRHSEDAKSARRLCAELGVALVEVPITFDAKSIEEAMRCIEIPSKAQIEIAVLCLPLAREISRRGFKACLSGEAADELFGGYGTFCIKAASASDTEVKQLRRESLAKMARGNFIRCNKAFMSAGVECRLPFMEQDLVESVIQLGKHDSPAGKGLLKKASESVLPQWIIKRTKDTFQGGSGISDAIARQIANPIRYYNAEMKRMFGYLPKD